VTVDAALQLRIQRYGWDRAVDDYERAWARQLAPARERLFAAAALLPGERVVDVACGTGLVSLRAAEAVGAGGEVVATDISARMVAAVAEAAEARGLRQVRVARTDAAHLHAVATGTMDAVLCALGLMYVPDVPAVLQEFRRALRPGGRAVAAVWGARARCGWAGIFPVVERRVATDVCPLFFHLGTGDALRAAFEAAGFLDVRSERVTAPLDYDSADDAADAAFAGGPVAMAYSRFDDATRAEARAEYIDTLAPFRRGDAYRIPGEFVVAVGRSPGPIPANGPTRVGAS
jgi:ubiquinone/menaquinone biosynthesis C-methylase UbiE